MRAAIVGVMAGFLGGPAAAMMPPEVYERARADAVDVVVIRVERVETPSTNLGNCEVHGAVALVERGQAFQPGQSVSVTVPCVREFNNDVPDSGVIWQDTGSLEASAFGRAFLDATGEIALYQYQQVTAEELAGTKTKSK